MTDITSISELAPRLRRREISPVEITRDCLARIEKLNPSLNAFVTVTAEPALAEAQKAEAEIGRGEWRGALHGVPVALKDLIDTAGVRTTAGSAIYKDRVPAQDAEVVRRLRQAGAVIVGKNNLHEFAYGGSSLLSYFGDVHNPWDVERVAGGSSGGSAAAVAAGLAYAAIGTDTAGSIREPAALCGCVGLKATYGRVSSRGVVPLAPSLDHVGPLAGTVADVAVVLQAVAGYDSADVTSADVRVPDYVSALGENLKSLRVGVPRAYFFDDLDAEVASAMEHALRGLQSLGAELRDVTLDVPTDRTLQAAESWAVHAEKVAKSPELYLPETLRRIRTGEKVSAAEYIQRAARVGGDAARHSCGLCGCGCDGDTDDADAGSGDCGVEGECGSAASGGIKAAAQYAAVQCVGIAGDFGALRIYREWVTDRTTDCGAALEGGSGVACGARV